ncbi:ArsI/CadI family heavy metal resistance metalloenzyme [Kaarinaea lacus]
MKRIHIHIAVRQLAESVHFYSTVFGAPPTVAHEDYAKWKLNDPAVNFAISHRGQSSGINHLGIQVDTDSELQEIAQRFDQAKISTAKQASAACCYAKSDKYWTLDPQGIAWESFHALGEISFFGTDHDSNADDKSPACCIPLAMDPVNNANADCCVTKTQDSGECCS